MQNDQLDGLLALKIVAEKLNFSAAAKELNVTPSAMSQSIKQLEGRLGVTLLSRTTRSTSLTEAGRRFLDQAGPAIDQILAAVQDVGSFAEKPSGLLRLNMPRMVYPSYLAPYITSFTKKYPDVTVEIFFEDAQSDVFKQGFDAGIRLSDILAKDMVAMKLYGPIRFVTAGSPKYLNKYGRPKHPQDLLAHNCIRARLGSRMYDRWEYEHKGKELEVQVKGSLIFNDSMQIQMSALEGAGLIYTMEDSIREKLESGKLETVLDAYAPKSDGFYLYYPQKSQVMPKLRAFIAHLKDENPRN